MLLLFCFTFHAERKEQIDKAEEKERLQKEKEQKEQREAEEKSNTDKIKVEEDSKQDGHIEEKVNNEDETVESIRNEKIGDIDDSPLDQVSHLLLIFSFSDLDEDVHHDRF